MRLALSTAKTILLLTAIAALSLPLQAQTGIAVVKASLGDSLPPAPQSLATAFSVGGNFTGVPGGAAGVSATAIPLPTNLQGVVLEIDGVAAPMLYARAGDVANGVPGQINFQVPALTTVGRVSVRVLVDGVEVASGFVNIIAASPGLFWGFDPVTQAGIIQNSDFSLNGPDNPAAPGDFIVAYGTGPGPFNIAVPDGDIPAPGTLPAPMLDVVCYLSASEVTPFTALQAQFVGLWQINITIPEGVSYLTGAVPLFCVVREPGTQVGIATNTVTVYLQ